MARHSIEGVRRARREPAAVHQSSESGVQSSPASSRSFSGVQIFSRASACSSGIGFAASATSSIALRSRRSSRTSASRPFSRSRSSSFSGRRPLVLGGVRERLDHLLLGDLDPLGLGDRRQHRLAPQLALGVGLRLLDQLLARFALHLQVGVGVHAAAGELAFDPLPAFGRARASTSSSGSSTVPRRRRRRPRRRGSPARRAARAPRRLARAMSARSSSSVSNSEASEANSSSSSGRTFSRTSLTSTVKTASLPARCSAW